MISMTAYWQQFKQCVEQLPEPAGNEEYSKQMSTAVSMIEIGLTIEQLGITEIKQVANKLHDKAKEYNNEVVFTAPDKEYRFNLPKITNTNSLIFAINYFQHLSNYAQVQYEGSINWLMKSFVVNSINEKKIPTSNQAKAMLAEIKRYCQNQNIAIDESQLLKTSGETAQEYIARITNICSTVKTETTTNEINETQATKDIKETTEPNEIEKLRRSLDDIKAQKDQLKIKIESFTKKHTEHNQAKQNHLDLKNEWQNKSPIIRFFYWLISWIVKVPLLIKIKAAEEQEAKTETALNQELASNQTPESCLSGMIIQLKKLNIEFKETEDQIIHEIDLEQEKQKKLANTVKTIEKESLEIKKDPVIKSVIKPVIKAEIKPAAPSSNVDYYYGFFKEYMPGRQTLQAAAVAAAAIVVQHLVYS